MPDWIIECPNMIIDWLNRIIECPNRIIDWLNRIIECPTRIIECPNRIIDWLNRIIDKRLRNTVVSSKEELILEETVSSKLYSLQNFINICHEELNGVTNRDQNILDYFSVYISYIIASLTFGSHPVD